MFHNQNLSKMNRINPDGTIQHITIHDSGDPSVGISPTYYTITGEFVFEYTEYLGGFQEKLIQLLDDYGFINGRARATTDVEERAQIEAEKTQDFSI
jgi:hypothetical protein